MSTGPDWLEEHGIAIAGPLADRFDVTWLVGFTQGLAGRLNSFAGFALLVFVFVMLGLLEIEDFGKRLRSPALQPQGMNMLHANREISKKLRRFMLVRTFASILTGLIVWAFAYFAGLELAAAWGAIAFTLNYIPFLGPFVATVLPTLFAIGQFDTWQMAVAVFAGLNLIQFLIGSYLEPLLIGRIPGDLAFRRHFCGVLLELHVGCAGRIHWRPHSHRVHHLLRENRPGRNGLPCCCQPGLLTIPTKLRPSIQHLHGRGTAGYATRFVTVTY